MKAELETPKVKAPRAKSKETKSEVGQETKHEAKEKPAHNVMRNIKMEKVVLSAGAVGPDLQKAHKLLEFLSSRKAQIITSSKRIPDFGVRPGLEVGTRVTVRGKEALDLLRKLLGAIDNQLKKKQVSENHFSFGIEEYIDIPGIEYQREIGIRGFNVTVVFTRAGTRITKKKIKVGSLPKKQHVTREEILSFMVNHFKTEFI